VSVVELKKNTSGIIAAFSRSWGTLQISGPSANGRRRLRGRSPRAWSFRGCRLGEEKSSLTFISYGHKRSFSSAKVALLQFVHGQFRAYVGGACAGSKSLEPRASSLHGTPKHSRRSGRDGR